MLKAKSLDKMPHLQKNDINVFELPILDNISLIFNLTNTYEKFHVETSSIKNEEFQREYAQIVNKFTAEFTRDFVVDGKIDWETLVRFNSSYVKATLRRS